MVIFFQLASYISLWPLFALALSDASVNQKCRASGATQAAQVTCFRAPVVKDNKNTASASRSVGGTLFVQAAVNPIPLNRLHTWRVRVIDDNGHPIRGLKMVVDGGMPDHNHALPTQPRLISESPLGLYNVGGFKFSMYGRWVVNFRFQINEQPLLAHIQFNLTPNSAMPIK